MYLPSDLTLSFRSILTENYHKGTMDTHHEGANVTPTPATGI